jgi:hypothetical protein
MYHPDIRTSVNWPHAVRAGAHHKFQADGGILSLAPGTIFRRRAAVAAPSSSPHGPFMCADTVGAGARRKPGSGMKPEGAASGSPTTDNAPRLSPGAPRQPNGQIAICPYSSKTQNPKPKTKNPKPQPLPPPALRRLWAHQQAEAAERDHQPGDRGQHLLPAVPIPTPGESERIGEDRSNRQKRADDHQRPLDPSIRARPRCLRHTRRTLTDYRHARATSGLFSAHFRLRGKMVVQIEQFRTHAQAMLATLDRSAPQSCTMRGTRQTVRSRVFACESRWGAGPVAESNQGLKLARDWKLICSARHDIKHCARRFRHGIAAGCSGHFIWAR